MITLLVHQASTNRTSFDFAYRRIENDRASLNSTHLVWGVPARADANILLTLADAQNEHVHLAMSVEGRTSIKETPAG